MKTITVIFHDDAANPAEGVRDAVKSIAEAHNSQLTEVDPNKVTISGGGLQAVWLDLQAVAPIQLSHDGSAEEHTALLKACQDAANAAKPKEKKKKDDKAA